MKRIPLYRAFGSQYRFAGKYAIVDDEDEKLVRSVTDRWLLHSEGYACTSKGTSRGARGTGKVLLMHRMILGLVDPKVHTDHQDHNRLNNRRSNIKACSQQENNQNLPFTGVGWHKQRNKWRAWAPQREGKPSKHLGLFNTREEAEREVAKCIR